MAMQYHGFPVQDFETDGTRMVEISLGPQNHVVLTRDDFELALVNSRTPDEFTAGVEAAKESKLQDWIKNRGPMSDLAQQMEAGNPQATTEHGSDSA